MARLAVIPPPPSFDPASYQPFDDEVNRAIDQILSEEASFESSRDEDWSHTGEDSPSVSSRDTSHNDRDVKKSRFFSKPSATHGTKAKRTKKPVAKRNITVVALSSESEDNSPHPDTDGEAGKEDEPDPGNETDVSMEMVDPPNASASGVPGPNVDDEAVVAEEDAIFASIADDKRDHLLHYLVSHPFMLNGVQPVQRSARRHFVDEIRKEAALVGMDDTSINRLIEYVRKLYLEDVGVPFQPLSEGLDDVPFGEEVDDDRLEKVRRRKARKRRLTYPEQVESKKSKRAKKARSSNEVSELSLHSTLQRDISQRITSPLQDPAQGQIEEKHDASLNAVDIGHAPERNPHLDDPKQVSEKEENNINTVKPENQHDRSAASDSNQARSHFVEKHNDSVRSREKRIKKALPSRQRRNAPQIPDMTVSTGSSQSEPELPPTNGLLIRALQDKNSKQAHEKAQGEAIKESSLLTADHANDPVISGGRASLPSKPGSASKPARETSITLLEGRSNERPENQREDDQNPTKQPEGNASRTTPAGKAQRHPSETRRKTIHELPDQPAKRFKNWRKREKKRQKKRQSHNGCQSNPPAGDQSNERQSTPAKFSTPAPTPETRTPQKETPKSKSLGLSPNPAEWDLDF